jgi:hypothetical protein
VSTRQCYVVVADASSRLHNLASLCGTIFDALDGYVVTARIDAYSDYADQMPADIRTAEEWLRARGLARGEGDPGQGIVVARADDIGWAIVRAYAPWSVRTSLHDPAGVMVATLDDGGFSITLELTAAQAGAFAACLGPDHSLVSLESSPWRDGGSL